MSSNAEEGVGSGSPPRVLHTVPAMVMPRLHQVESADSTIHALSGNDMDEVELSPFVHQVGGHFPLICLDTSVLCKPLNGREHRFYLTCPNVLKPHTPGFEGTMQIETAEDDDGYILLRGEPPPAYYRKRRRQIQLERMEEMARRIERELRRQDISKNSETNAESSTHSSPKNGESSSTNTATSTAALASNNFNNACSSATASSGRRSRSRCPPQTNYRLRHNESVDIEYSSSDADTNGTVTPRTTVNTPLSGGAPISPRGQSSNVATPKNSTESPIRRATFERSLSISSNSSSKTTRGENNQSQQQPQHQQQSDSQKYSSSSADVFCNPWALKCHRDYLKKLGMLKPKPRTTRLAQQQQHLGERKNFEVTAVVIPIETTPTSAASTPVNEDGGGGGALQLASSSEDLSAADSTVSTASASSSAANKKPKPQLYLLLENLVTSYAHPCILDLKVGIRQYQDGVSAAKKQRKIAKSEKTTSAKLGLRVCGLQVYNSETGKFTCRDKYYGRQLDAEGFKASLREFFGIENEVKIPNKKLIEFVLKRLREIVKILMTLDSFRFYTSSLLVTYDGEELEEDEEEENQQAERKDSTGYIEDPKVNVRMIDFAHSTHRGMGDETVYTGPDDGFLFGLRTLEKMLEEFIQEKGNRE